MSKIVFVTGLEESGRSTVIDMVLEGCRSKLVKLLHVEFESMGLGSLAAASASDMGKLRETFYKKVERKVSDGMKSGMSIVVEGPLTLKTESGYLPLVPKEFFESFAPDVFILFEVPKEKSAEIDWKQQEVNRAYAAMFASLSGCALKIIDVGSGGVKDALKECTAVVESYLGR